jgi:formylglycine-generating enzyme required for sulfatase activity
VGRPSRSRIAGLLLLATAVALPACVELVDEMRGRLGLDEMPPPKEPIAPAYLAFDLPLGMSVAVDGKDLGVNPAEPIELPPGEHEVAASHSCERHASAKFVVVADETTTVTIEAFTLLAVTDLHLAISSLHGEPLAPKLKIGRFHDQKSVGESEHAIPADGWVKLLACSQRIIVTSGNPAVGGYWEDIPMVGPKTLGRKIVLAPGPDMVRLPGGPFTMGMRTQTLEDIEAFNRRTDTDEDDGTWSPVPQREVVLQPFEIDRHPVTAAQFEACWNDGACKQQEYYLGMSEDESHCAAITRVPDEPRRPGWTRAPRPGRADFPVNCVSYTEAAKYCNWVGKRFPTSDEWEYAARSGQGDRDCAPGKYESACSVSHGGYGTDVWSARNPAVCKIPADTTAQGVCDFMHFDEWVVNPPLRAGHNECRTYDRPVRGSGYAAWDPGGCAEADKRDIMVTFRCARDLGVSRLGDIDR